ncbi:MAG: hypothetical protein AAF549_01780 [Pseudomonadota bacterium]
MSAKNEIMNHSEKDLQSMMRDPRYWRDKDLSFIEKVTKTFERLYNK